MVEQACLGKVGFTGSILSHPSHSFSGKHQEPGEYYRDQAICKRHQRSRLKMRYLQERELDERQDDTD